MQSFLLLKGLNYCTKYIFKINTLKKTYEKYSEKIEIFVYKLDET